MRPIAALAVGTLALTVVLLAQVGKAVAQAAKPAQLSVTAVRHSSISGVTRVAIEVSGAFEHRTDHLHNPERVYYDILNARPKFDNKRLYTEDLDDPFVKRIRVAETNPGVTRIVLDLSGNSEATASVLSSPDRLIVELRAGSAAPPAALPAPTVTLPPTSLPPTRVTLPPTSLPPTRVTLPPTPVMTATPIAAAPQMLPDPPPPADAIRVVTPGPAVVTPTAVTPVPSALSAPQPEPAAPPLEARKPASPVAPATSLAPTTAAAKPAPLPEEIAKPARHTSTGNTSLIRALGLKLQRVVIDPGHGGHDEGTQGPKGLLEKDLVLDVALRVGKLIEDRMGAEVIYTRSDDTFIPLEGRTQLANDKKADLFLSIHANSSPTQHVTGVETYYLNFTDVKDALDTASRENASSQKSVFELHDLIERISAHDKGEESRDFASRIQTALFAFSARNFPAEKNRGVRKAPFIVLIGANMPSVLAEIGFLSNPREELLLKKADYKQKLAEALFQGISKYAAGLSHFQMAEN